MQQLVHRLVRYEERASGVPGRYITPVIVAGIALQVAVLGMYWDIGYHIDHGRDQGVITPPHMFIVAGLQGIVLAALLHGVMRGPAARNERRLRALGLRMSPGGIVMLVCGGIALLGFPLDAGWHALFGEDVTLWGPTHLFMIGGAGVSTLGMWMVMRQGFELGRPRRISRRAQARVAGALLIGLSTFQAEFDFGVPQFQLLYQPVLIAFAAGVALVCARSVLGRWGAFQVLAIYFVIRGALAIFVGPIIGYTTPHFPLYVAEAAMVELAAALAPRAPLRFALLSGLGIGTVGLAAEWGWSHVWMPHPWPSSLLPQAPILALVAALAGSVLGARMSQSLAEPGSERASLPPIPARPVVLAAVVALVAVFFPLPRTGGDGTRAAVMPTPAGPGRVNVAVTLDPRDASKGNQWFEVLSWQGRTPGHTRQITRLREVAPGRYATTRAVPVTGNWKTMLRLANGTHIMGMPIYMPASPQGNRPGVPVAARSGPMVADTYLLQREARGGPAWLTTTAYAVLAVIVAIWLALLTWALGLAEPNRAARSRATVPSTWPPPAAPA
jgi:hypothetical protein